MHCFLRRKYSHHFIIKSHYADLILHLADRSRIEPHTCSIEWVHRTWSHFDLVQEIRLWEHVHSVDRPFPLPPEVDILSSPNLSLVSTSELNRCCHSTQLLMVIHCDRIVPPGNDTFLSWNIRSDSRFRSSANTRSVCSMFIALLEKIRMHV
jgi:hypothetical protein